MKRILAILLLAFLPALAETRAPDLHQWRWWNYSAVALSASTAFDMSTSLGGREINSQVPSFVLGPERRFTNKTVVVYGAIMVGTLILQRVILRRRGGHAAKKLFIGMNLAVSGLHVGAGIRNCLLPGVPGGS